MSGPRPATPEQFGGARTRPVAADAAVASCWSIPSPRNPRCGATGFRSACMTHLRRDPCSAGASHNAGGRREPTYPCAHRELSTGRVRGAPGRRGRPVLDGSEPHRQAIAASTTTQSTWTGAWRSSLTTSRGSEPGGVRRLVIASLSTAQPSSQSRRTTSPAGSSRASAHDWPAQACMRPTSLIVALLHASRQ